MSFDFKFNTMGSTTGRMSCQESNLVEISRITISPSPTPLTPEQLEAGQRVIVSKIDTPTLGVTGVIRKVYPKGFGIVDDYGNSAYFNLDEVTVYRVY